MIGILRSALVVYLVAGVPVLYSLYQLAGAKNPILVYYPLAITFGVLALLNMRSLLRRKTHVLFYALFGALAVATWLVRYRHEDTSFYPQMVSLVVCFVWLSTFISVYFAIRTPKQLAIALDTLDIIGLLITASVYLSFVGRIFFGFTFGESVDQFGQQRAFGPLGDQVGFVIVLFALLALTQGQWLRMAVHVGAIVLTGTRGAMISLAIGMLWVVWYVLFLRQRQVQRRRYRLIFAVLLAAAAFGGFLASPFGATAADRLFSAEQRNATISDRLGPMRLGLQVFSDNPISGVGFLGFSRLESAYDFERTTVVGANTWSTQNQYVQTATDGGIFGLMLLVLLLWQIIRTLLLALHHPAPTANRELFAFVAYVVAIAIGNQAAVWLLPSAATGYFLLLIAGIGERTLLLKRQLAPAPAEETPFFHGHRASSRVPW